MEKTLLNDAAIDAVTRLAQGSAGTINSRSFKTPVESVGLPTEIPFLVQEGASPKIIQARDLLEPWRLAPERRTGCAKTFTLHSFIDLVNRHKDEQSSVIFGDTRLPSPKLTAIIDYHGVDKSAHFLKHSICYEFPLSEEFEAWIGSNGASMTQTDFAVFLENRISELSAPSGAEREDFEKLFKTKIGTPNEIIELSRGLEINVSSRIKQAIKLQSGESEIIFVEEHSNTAGERLTVPGLMMISVHPFVDGEPIRIPARLRYRKTSNGLTWSYDMWRLNHWLRECVKSDLVDAGAATGLPTYEGAAEI